MINNDMTVGDTGQVMTKSDTGQVIYELIILSLEVSSWSLTHDGCQIMKVTN